MTTINNEIIRVDHLKKSFGDFQVLKDISFSLHQGEVLGIIGPSGSGKSTLLRCICQLETVTGGTINISGRNLVENGIYTDKNTQRAIGLDIGLVFQNFNLFPHFSVLRNITEAQCIVLGKSKEESETVAMELLKKMGLESKALFTALYHALIGKDQGPRLANFMKIIGKEKLAQILSVY